MKAYYFRFLLFFALILRGSFAFGQVANDECETSTVVPDARIFCGVFKNDGATATNFQTGCFNGTGKDLSSLFLQAKTIEKINKKARTVRMCKW